MKYIYNYIYMLYITLPQYLYFQILFQRMHKLIKISIFKNRCICITLYYLIWAQYFAKIRSQLQFTSLAQYRLTLCNPMNHSTPGLPVHHQLSEFTQTHAHRVGDVIQPSHPLSPPSPPAPNPSQNQGLFQWVNSSHEVAKILEFQLQHQSFQSTPRTDLL